MDMNNSDFLYALQLQEQFEKENENGSSLATASNINVMDMNNADFLFALQLQEQDKEKNGNDCSIATASNETIKTSIVDKFWELNDPNPDIHGLFLEFNSSYFWNKLQGVEVRWSNRMTLCAGVCCYEGRGGLCSVRLSLPLLKLRPRKDLVETLLHEMIHAYLFVSHNNRDHNAHGPEFLKHMHRINKITGANITVFHNFHDEVNEYRQHWWLCNGPCRHRPPYYGIVRRAMNRAPSANDFWWEEHRTTCGGTYEKIREPEGNNAKRKRTELLTGVEKKAKSENVNINTFLLSSDGKQHGNRISHKKTDRTPNKDQQPAEHKNIHSLGSPNKRPKSSQITPFSGKGHVLGSSLSQNSDSVNKKSTLHFYFESRKNLKTSDKHSFFDDKSKCGNQRESCVSPLKDKSGSFKGSYSSPLNNVSLPSIEKRINMQNIGTANARSSPQTKENARKMFLPAGKLSTASPLNHIRKIFMVSDDDSNIKRLSNVTLPDILLAKSPTQKKQISVDDSSLRNPIILSNTSSDSVSESTPTNVVMCPVCNQEVQNTDINTHLDSCLSC